MTAPRGSIGAPQTAAADLEASGAAVRALVRSALLARSAGRATVQDLVDAAELLQSVGENGAAATLRDVVRIRTGFTDGERLATAASSDPVVTGIAQLRHLMARGPETPADATPPRSPQGPPQAAAIAPLCTRLRASLAAPQAPPDSATILRELDGLFAASPFAAHSLPVDLELAELGFGLAGQDLRRFFGTIRQLAFPPFGSAGLLHAASRLDPAGLGPYFVRTPQLVRDHRDLFGMIQAASPGPIGDDDLQRWVILLSAWFSDPALQLLIDALGDRGLTGAVRAIGARAISSFGPASDPALMWCLRDVGIDLGALDLAVQAQQRVVDLTPGNALEWSVLGAVAATAGEFARAEAAFLVSLRLGSDAAATDERLAAIRERRFERFAVVRGYGTPAPRRLLRFRRSLAARKGSPHQSPGSSPA